MPTANLKSCTLHYSDLSSATGAPFSTWRDKPTRTILFLHGLGSTQNFYYPVVRLLQPNYRCILLDFPNSGRSALLPEGTEITVELLVNTVFELLDSLRINGPVTVVGHSLGGLAALHAAQMFPSRVEGLVLLGPVYPRPELAAALEQRMATVWMGGMDSMANLIPNNALGSKATSLQRAFVRELLLAQNAEGYTAMCKCLAEATVGDLSKLTTRALIIAGKDDAYTTLETAERYKAEIAAEVELHVIEGLGHWHGIEIPEEVAELAEQYLAQLVQPAV